MPSYIMALDAGTTSNRCILFDRAGHVCSMAQKEFTQFFPKPGWVEHDAEEIWSVQLEVAQQAMRNIAQATELNAVGAWAVAGLTEGLLPGKAGELLTLGASAAAGVAVYFPAAVLLRLDEGQLALKMVKRVWKRG